MTVNSQHALRNLGIAGQYCSELTIKPCVLGERLHAIESGRRAVKDRGLFAFTEVGDGIPKRLI
jgi:hypothetical protein